MRILIINRFFWPDESSTAMLAADLAEDLVAAGHDVTVACARLLYDKPKAPLKRFEEWRGVKIHRLPSTRFGRASLPGRFSDLMTFHASLVALAPFKFAPDAVYVMTDPAMVLFDAMWIARLRGARVVHHVMDLYPDIAVALGALRAGGVIERIMNRLMRRLLRGCDQVIALGECMAARLTLKGVRPERIPIVPPWGTDAPGGVNREENAFRHELGLGSEDFLVMYSGNMGKGHHFETVLGAAEELRSDPRVHFLFVGGGARMEEIRQAARGKNLTNVRLVPYQPRERLHETLPAADVHLITQDPVTTGLIVPSKLAGILASGRPSLHVGDAQSEIGRALASGGCGLNFAPGDAHGLARAISELKDQPVRREAMGVNARNIFLQDYERRSCTAKIRNIIENCAHAPATRPGS